MTTVGIRNSSAPARDAATDVDRGRSARRDVTRDAHAEWHPPAGRPDPVDLLSAQDAVRSPDLVPVRHGRMSDSAFTFYRGAAAIMASDLASTSATGFRVQLCGDAHLSNLGVFASPERQLLFDLNDFDETLPGPWEWDLKRLATSFVIAGRNNEFRSSQTVDCARTCARAYREAMRAFASSGVLSTWYARANADEVAATLTDAASKKVRAASDKGLSKARRRTSASVLAKLTEVHDGQLQFIDQAPLVVPLRSLEGLGESTTQPAVRRPGWRSPV